MGIGIKRTTNTAAILALLAFFWIMFSHSGVGHSYLRGSCCDLKRSECIAVSRWLGRRGFALVRVCWSAVIA